MKKIGLFALLTSGLIGPAFGQTVVSPDIAALVCANNTVVPTPVSGQFFYVQCDSSGKLITTSSGGGGTPGGSMTQVQYNNAGAFGGISGWTTDGANALTGGASSILTAPAIKGANIYPSADSTTAIKITKADTATSLLVVDSTNSRVGINGTPTTAFQVFAASGSAAIGNILFSPLASTSGATGFTLNSDTASGNLSLNARGSASVGGGLNLMPLSGTIFSGSAATGGLIIGTNTNAPLVFYTGASTFVSERLRILGSAATFNFGGPDAAAPGAVTETTQSVLAGTSNTGGANRTWTGSLGTGTFASGGDLIFQTSASGAAATVQNTATTALTIKGATQTVQIASGKALQLGNAYTAGVPVVTGYLSITDSTGTVYKFPACTGC